MVRRLLQTWLGLLEDCRLILRHNDDEGGSILVMIKFNESPDNLVKLLRLFFIRYICRIILGITKFYALHYFDVDFPVDFSQNISSYKIEFN